MRATLPIPASRQRQLPLADPRIRPTVGMDGAKHLLDLSEDEILALLEDGRILFAWNIGLGEDRREVRILRHSLDDYLARLTCPPNQARPQLSEDAARKLLLPPGHDKPFLTNGQIQRALNCVSDHVLHLVDAKALTLQPGTKYMRGPNGSALVTVASFGQFLTARRLL